MPTRPWLGWSQSNHLKVVDQDLLLLEPSFKQPAIILPPPTVERRADDLIDHNVIPHFFLSLFSFPFRRCARVSGQSAKLLGEGCLHPHMQLRWQRQVFVVVERKEYLDQIRHSDEATTHAP